MSMTANILVLVQTERGFLAVNLGDPAVTQALLNTLPSGQAAEPASLMAPSTAIAACQTGQQKRTSAPETQPDSSFERQVEHCLGHLSHYAWLGQSGLALELLIENPNPIERGKAVREVLLAAIERLRPAGARPSAAQCAPREWHSYAILYDAYVAEVSNRDIMSRLYISEGTFNRRRREALHAVACTVLEVKRSTRSAAQSRPPQIRRPLPLLSGGGSLAGWPMGPGGSC